MIHRDKRVGLRSQFADGQQRAWKRRWPLAAGHDLRMRTCAPPAAARCHRAAVCSSQHSLYSHSDDSDHSWLNRSRPERRSQGRENSFKAVAGDAIVGNSTMSVWMDHAALTNMSSSRLLCPALPCALRGFSALPCPVRLRSEW